jgi:DNA-directed RNA polymerase subunit D
MAKTKKTSEEKIESADKLLVALDTNEELANAVRRSVSEIPVLAIDEVDFYKNDSALYDQIIAHRLGLVPLKNQKLKKDDVMQLKLSAIGPKEVLSGELGDDVVFSKMPIVILDKEQELELVARARTGIGREHAKFTPGLVFYRIMPKITIAKEGEKYANLAETYPKIFSFENGKLKVRENGEVNCDLDQDDVAKYEGIKITPSEKITFVIESYGQMDSKEIFLDAVKALRNNLSELSKGLK